MGGKLFGTDGVRGRANADLTPELALSVARAAAGVLADPARGHPARAGGGRGPPPRGGVGGAPGGGGFWGPGGAGGGAPPPRGAGGPGGAPRP